MEKKSPYQHGQFCWVDLQSRNVDASKNFYTELMGWDARDMPTDRGPSYTMFLKNGLPTAGMGPMPPGSEQAGVPPVWNNYIAVTDIDATIGAAEAAGARVLMPAMQVMEHGSMAFLQDPTGAAFGLWQADKHIGAGWVNDVGGFCWNEFYSHDLEKAAAFYSKVFDWDFSVSKGTAGDYWSIKNNDRPNGGAMQIRPDWGDVPPHWAVYFTVGSLAGAVEKAKSLGASVFMPQMEAKDVGIFSGLQEPDGARFFLIQMAAGVLEEA